MPMPHPFHTHCSGVFAFRAIRQGLVEAAEAIAALGAGGGGSGAGGAADAV